MGFLNLVQFWHSKKEVLRSRAYMRRSFKLNVVVSVTMNGIVSSKNLIIYVLHRKTEKKCN